DGAEPVPEPLCGGGAQHDLAAGARHVDHRALAIAERETMQRAVALIAADGPLVLADGFRGHEAGRVDEARRDIEGNRLRIPEVEPPYAEALRKVDDRIRPRRATQAHRRRAEQILHLDAVKL